jgi:hypothetical protein
MEVDFWNSMEVANFCGISFYFHVILRNSVCKIPWNPGGNTTWNPKKYWSSCTFETWRHADMVMETWRHENMETWRHKDMKTWKHGVIDMDMET